MILTTDLIPLSLFWTVSMHIWHQATSMCACSLGCVIVTGRELHCVLACPPHFSLHDVCVCFSTVTLGNMDGERQVCVCVVRIDSELEI